MSNLNKDDVNSEKEMAERSHSVLSVHEKHRRKVLREY